MKQRSFANPNVPSPPRPALHIGQKWVMLSDQSIWEVEAEPASDTYFVHLKLGEKKYDVKHELFEIQFGYYRVLPEAKRLDALAADLKADGIDLKKPGS